MTTLPSSAQWVYEFLEQKHWSFSSLGEDKKFRKLLQGLAFTDLLPLVERLKGAGKQAAVVPLYSSWLAANAGLSPHLFAAWFNLGVEFSLGGDDANAITSYKNALVIKPDMYQAALNLGLQYERKGDLNLALETWRGALQPDEARTALLNHRGRTFENLKRYGEATETLFASLLTDPKQPDALHHWVYIRQRMCDWPIYDNRIPGLSAQDVIDCTGPLSILAAFDDIALQNRHVKDWLDKKAPPAVPRLSPENGYAHDRIRVGYMSSDYCTHPISYLMAELFERHDRSRFEVYGYCSTKENDSDIRRRIIASFDKFVSIINLTDDQVAQRIRQDEIDILVDLNGLTLGTRMFALRARPAPVQMTYLGYIGSIPLPELDYMLCDEFTVPKRLFDSYHPTPLYIPGNYQANDTKLPVGPTPTRAVAGLPDDKFVFCCFSNNYKITDYIFDAWLTVLKRTANSVLWLLADNEWARRNMVARAQAQGVAPERLIFAERVQPEDYLGRLPLADLFLDTHPYNAGTTASDALRMGLPLVTLCGECFASRMAGSLLHSVGLEWGVASTLDEYVEKAVEAANSPAKYREIRQAVSGDVWRRTIGNIEEFVPRLEGVFQSVLKRP